MKVNKRPVYRIIKTAEETFKLDSLKVLLENILQEEYKGQWIEKVQLYYEGELLSLN